ncbi:cellulose synthase complex periplasmic endoglucanase BcsZ [Pseudomonas guariconensis]|uniref:cellulose synthase complex periplasmic endoglucanase BcsZ n=1 Tax=Pseudomonas TaxID=286 RepID=UPI0020978D79|nr:MULTISPECIES: cellulose synthase complex periplasmic endoglucanase BcsZ [Pseudomonas]MCO7641967.1 cellulose synthase complex periplasmic endoglucanase BcsZ [Pseudomonas sp. S 311-6]MCO7516767.1 cellulose synthase complex periplasmic endoglucanase BcsZ [Pseudomonas putida]MCO7566980.1 cellulose synthase complex periplasmic endoglucanase BcsZ [Pseudomonas mosselii]MCO7597062.1 cellulose synthase complex periplasmic endoglucanase BcsZ [Pseudomonas guariconensis]MCO7607173.1 cellulose synthase 
MRRLVLLLLALALPTVAGAAPTCAWPAWERFKTALVSGDGRVIDPSDARLITTSEGQSYGLFFALVNNDRATFAQLLRWTTNNLAQGDLARHLPAWLWGRDAQGQWQVLDANNASDADLWIAYSLLEAGRLWQAPGYTQLGQHLLWRIAAQTLRKLPGLGVMLLPADHGFEDARGWRLNLSYLPLQLLDRFAQVDPLWGELAGNTRRLLREASAKGFAPDWLLWTAAGTIAPDPQHGNTGAYDAIRVYLWLGMLAKDAAQRVELQHHFAPMVALTVRNGQPPETVDVRSGQASGAGPGGFSAALLPLLAVAPDAGPGLRAQRLRLQEQAIEPRAYYNQVLALFGQGWDEARYRFDKAGRLLPAWSASCTD